MASRQEILRARRLEIRQAKTRRRPPRLPKIAPPTGAEIELRRFINNFVAELEIATREIVFPEIPSFVRTDQSDLERVIGGLRIKVGQIFDPESIIPRVEGVGASVAKSHKTKFIKTMRVAGLDVLGSDAGVSAHIEEFVTEGVSLIRSIGTRHLGDVERLLTQSAAKGLRHEVLRDQLQERLGINRRRAALIARDQTLTLQSKINRVRQQNVGVTHYFWSTSRDEKVRGLKDSDTMNHAVLDGTRQAWASPPVTSDDGGRAHPGEDVNCRCTATPDVSNLLNQ